MHSIDGVESNVKHRRVVAVGLISIHSVFVDNVSVRGQRARGAPPAAVGGVRPRPSHAARCIDAPSPHTCTRYHISHFFLLLGRTCCIVYDAVPRLHIPVSCACPLRVCTRLHIRRLCLFTSRHRPATSLAHPRVSD